LTFAHPQVFNAARVKAHCPSGSPGSSRFFRRAGCLSTDFRLQPLAFGLLPLLTDAEWAAFESVQMKQAKLFSFEFD
jgi:hypothetical protein